MAVLAAAELPATDWVMCTKVEVCLLAVELGQNSDLRLSMANLE